MEHTTVHTAHHGIGRRPVRALLQTCGLALALVAVTSSSASAGTVDGTVSAGCQAHAGDPSGPPIGPVSNQPSVTATITHPDSATAGAAFDVSVDLSGWLNSVVAVNADDTELIVRLDLTGATESSVEAVVGPPGPGAAANEPFTVPTATTSVTPAGSGPVTVSLNSWAVDNSPANVFVECTIQSGSVSAQIPLEGGDTTTTAPPSTQATATTVPAASGGTTSTTTAPPSSTGTLAAGGFDANTVVLVGAGLCAIGLLALWPAVRRRFGTRATAVD